MMHGHEKSSSAIVAVKPTNKVEHTVAEQSATEQTAAEPVEPRAEAEGNGRPAQHAPGTVPGTRAPGAGLHTAQHRRGYPRWEPYAGKLQVRVWCSEASCHSSGWKSRQQRSPVAVVVISSNGEGNRSVESLEVKASEGRAYRSDPYRGASNLAGRSKCVNREAPKYLPRVKRIAGGLGVPSRSDLGEGDVGIEVWTSDDRAPRGHRERHAKKEWSAKARNHPRVASALPHSEGIAYKPPCGEIAMCPRVGRMGSIK